MPAHACGANSCGARDIPAACRPSDEAETGTENGSAVHEPLAVEEERADLIVGPSSSAVGAVAKRKEGPYGLDMQIMHAAAVVRAAEACQ